MAPLRLTGSALEQHDVGQDHRGTTVNVEDHHDVLQEVETSGDPLGQPAAR
jgi:hypothetical protein